MFGDFLKTNFNLFCIPNKWPDLNFWLPFNSGDARAGDHWIVPTHWFSIHFTLLFGITACPHHHKQWKQKVIAKGDFYSCSEIIKAGNYFMPPYLPPSVHPSKSIHDISIGTQNIFLQGHKNGVREEKFSALSSGQAQFFTGFYTIWLCAWSKHLDERKMWRKHHKWYMPWRHVNWRCNSIKSASCLLFFGLKHCYVKTNTCKLIVRSSCHSSERESPILAKSVTDWKQNHLFFHHYFSNFPLWFRRSVGIYVFWLSGIFGADQQNTIFVIFRWKLCTCVGEILHFRNFVFREFCIFRCLLVNAECRPSPHRCSRPTPDLDQDRHGAGEHGHHLEGGHHQCRLKYWMHLICFSRLER